jgi:hypothetical protein
VIGRHAWIVAAVAAAAIGWAPVHAQLPMITIPRGALRLEFAGAFYPNNDDWIDGSKRPIIDELNGNNNLIVTTLQSRLGAVLGQSVGGLTLGGITGIAAREHGVGDIGLAFGLTRRITIYGVIPVVYVRSRVSDSLTTSGGRLGINPGAPLVGTDAGHAQTGQFFTQFDAALTHLGANIRAGTYTGATLALAQQTLASATTLRSSLATLLVDPAHATPVLPLITDPAGVQLTQIITTLENTFSTTLSITDLTLQPALPTTAIDGADYNTLLTSPGGIGLSSPNNLPKYGIGDMQAGVAVELLSEGKVGDARWRTAWARLSAAFPNGAPADTGVLLAQPTGDRHPTVQLAAIAEIGRHTVGLRGEIGYQHGFAASLRERVVAPDNVLSAANSVAALRSTPGDSMSITMRPFIAFAPHLAATAMVQFWRRSGSSTDYLTGQVAVPGVAASIVDEGSAANALVMGIGIAYSHTGVSRYGEVSMPVEASWSVERTVASGTGIFPVALTTRVSLRIYRPLTGH